MMLQAVFRIFAFLFSVVLIAQAAAAAPCDRVEPPTENTNNVWYCWTEGDTAIVFLHGLHSSSRGAWLDEKRPETYWPRLAATDPSLKNAAVFLAGFFTGLDSTTFGMREASGSLNTQLNAKIDGHPAVIAKKNILFVAHSLGGILVRDLLTRYKDEFAGKRIGLLLVASPSSGSNVINKLSFANSIIVGSQMVGELAIGSRYLAQLDDDFKSLLKDPRMAIEGREIFEQYWVETDPSGLTTYVPDFIKHRWKPLVPQADTAKYFVDPQQIDGSDHITIAKPDKREALSHQKLIKVYNLMLGAKSPECTAPPDFEIDLDIKTSDAERGLNPKWPDAAKAVLPQYKFLRHLVDGDLVDTRGVPRDKDSGRYFYRPRGAFPCRGEKFDAEFSRIPPESKQVSSRSGTKLCFLRSLDRSDEKFAKLACSEGAVCAINLKAAGLAEPCLNKADWQVPKFISSAKAGEPAEKLHWEVPSLETLTSLPEEIRTGYAEFTLRASPNDSLNNADAFSYAVTVNGVDLYIDGLARHAEHFPFNPKEGLKHVLALENLGFTGGTTGYEQIALEIKYWRGANLLRTDHIVRDDYVSYRHAPLITVTDAETKDSYQWSGVYRPAKMQAAYEIMLSVGGTKDTALKDKQAIDDLAKSYDGQPVIGVIRPGRKENKNYATTFGVKLPTGQVKSLFTEDEAGAICKWVTTSNDLPEWMRDYSYLFKFPAENFNELKDRGERVGECRKV